ncbi:hypothetical protein ABKN59_011410 [Abortiporus biennis]
MDYFRIQNSSPHRHSVSNRQSTHAIRGTPLCVRTAQSMSQPSVLVIIDIVLGQGTRRPFQSIVAHRNRIRRLLLIAQAHTHSYI